MGPDHLQHLSSQPAGNTHLFDFVWVLDVMLMTVGNADEMFTDRYSKSAAGQNSAAAKSLPNYSLAARLGNSCS